jgi:hypothetical protein
LWWRWSCCDGMWWEICYLQLRLKQNELWFRCTGCELSDHLRASITNTYAVTVRSDTYSHALKFLVHLWKALIEANDLWDLRVICFWYATYGSNSLVRWEYCHGYFVHERWLLLLVKLRIQ